MPRFLRKYRIYYLPFLQSDVEASDVVLYAFDEEAAEREFERIKPGYNFKRAEETS